MQSAIELILKLNSDEANANLKAVKASIDSLSNQKIDPMDTASIQKAGGDIASAFSTSRTAAQEVYARQQQIIAAMAMAGQTGTSEFKAAQAELVKAKQNADEFDKALAKASAENPGKNLGDSFKGMASSMGAVFGGNLLTSGLSSLTGSFSSVVAAGKNYDESIKSMKVGMALTGSSAESMDAKIKEQGASVKEIANKYGLATGSVKAYAQTALTLGGATGKANSDLTTLAVAIEKSTGGMVDGNMAIRLFSKGISDPESSFAVARLTKQFPQLGAAIKDIKDPAQATQAALSFFAPALNQMEINSQGASGAVQRAENSFASLKTQLGYALYQGVSPFVEAFSNNLIPILQVGASGVSELIGYIKPLAPAFAVAGTAVAAVAIGLGALKGAQFLTGMASDAIQFGLAILQKVVPALVTEGAAEGALIINKEALTFATAKSTAANFLHAAGTGAAALGTATLSAATWALNAAFVASPIGWIALGVGAVAGAMYLLYQNVEPVRDAFDQAWIIIKAGAAAVIGTVSALAGGVAKLFKLDFSGAMESFSGAGAAASGAFIESFQKNTDKLNLDKAKKSADDAFKDGVAIKLKVDNQESLKEYTAAYEDMQNQISALNSKKSSSGLTSDEQKQLDDLSKKAQDTALKIGEIAPETKQGFKTIVDSSGNLKEVWDINIAKAKEFANSAKNGDDMKASAEKYSSALEKQGSVVSDQIARQAALKTQIDKTSDVKKRDEMIAKYNEEQAAIDKTKQEVVKSYEEGAKAGLLTNDAYEKLGKQLGVTGAQAREMELSKELTEATKSGAVTESQIVKIADKYGVSRDRAKEILAEQEKITAETKKTQLEALSWSDTLKTVKESQTKAREEYAKALLDYKEGKITAEALAAAHEKATKAVKEFNDETNLTNSVVKSVSKDKELQTIKQLDLNDKEEKKNKEIKDTLSEQLSLIEKKAALDENSYKYELEMNAAIHNRALTKQEELDSEKNSLSILEEERQKVIEIAAKRGALKDSAGKVIITSDGFDFSKAKIKPEDKDKLNTEISKLGNDVAKSNVNLVKLNWAFSDDKEKTDESLAKLAYDIEKSKLDAKIKIHAATEVDAAKLDLTELKREIQKEMGDVSRYSVLSVEYDPLKLATAEKAVQDTAVKIEAANKTLREKELSEANKNALAKAALIRDFAEREHEIKLTQLQITLDAELNKEGATEDERLAAYQKFLDEKAKADADYLTQTKPVAAALTAMYDELSKGFTIGKIDNSAYTAAANEIKKSQAEARKAYIDGSSTAVEYYSKMQELDAKAAANKKQSTNQLVNALNSGFAGAAQAGLDFSEKQYNAQVQSFQKNINLSTSLNKKLSTISDKTSKEYLETSKEISDADTQAKNAMAATYAFAATSIGESALNALAQGKSAGKAALSAAFDLLQAMVPIWSAQIIGGSMATPQSIATLGAAGIAEAAALTLAMTAAVQVAKAAVEGFFVGGYTGDGNPRDVAGVVHKKELVVSAAGTAVGENKGVGLEMNKGVDVKAKYLAQGRMSALISDAVNSTIIVNNNYSELAKAVAAQTEALKELNKSQPETYNSRKVNITADITMTPKMDKDRIFQAFKEHKLMQLQA